MIDFTKLIKRNICKNQNIKEQECWYNSSYRIQRQTDNHQRNVYERKEIYLGVAEQDLVPMRHMILHLHCSQYLQKNNMQDWFSKLDDRYSLNIYVMSWTAHNFIQTHYVNPGPKSPDPESMEGFLKKLNKGRYGIMG